MQLVLITWYDAEGCASDWRFLENTEHKIMICKSVGWLIYDGDDCKTLIPHMTDNLKQGCGDMTIPTIAIKSIQKLVTPND